MYIHDTMFIMDLESVNKHYYYYYYYTIIVHGIVVFPMMLFQEIAIVANYLFCSFNNFCRFTLSLDIFTFGSIFIKRLYMHTHRRCTKIIVI